MATKLVRKKIETKELEQITDEGFVKEAKSLLGYRVLETAWTFKKVLDILNELGIEPFDDVKVVAYKAERQEALFKRTRRSNNWGGTVTTTTRGEWVMDRLSGYRKEVPAFALVRAAAVKKALNKAKIEGTFHVEELQKRTSRSESRPAFDPFMVLEVLDRKLYLDVWDEPKFEGRRTK
jgi:hypothetical protein